MKEEPEYDELCIHLFELMDKGLVIPYNDEGTIRWAPAMLVTDDQVERALTKEQVIAHYKKGGE